MRDIAELANVSLSTVSEALRSGPRSRRVGKDTANRVLRIAQSYNYQPGASAKALATGRTFNLGFLLSSKVTMGFSNNYYGRLMEGVYSCCVDNGYHCVIGWSDMASLDGFAMPTKIASRAVDGLILVGHIDDGVAQKILDSGIPFMILEGKFASVPPGVLCVRKDYDVLYKKVFNYLYHMGHRRFGIGGVAGAYEKNNIQRIFNDFALLGQKDQVTLDFYCCGEDEYDKFVFGKIVASEWEKSRNRPTAILGHDQFVVGFLGGALEKGCVCPDDFSLFSTSDSILCERIYPAISSFEEPCSMNSYKATQVLFDYMNEKMSWIDACRKSTDLWLLGDIIERSTTGVAPQINSQR